MTVSPFFYPTYVPVHLQLLSVVSSFSLNVSGDEERAFELVGTTPMPHMR